VADLESFSYDKKQKSIKRTHRKRKVSLDSSVLRTTEKVIIDTKKYNMNQLYLEGLYISHAYYDKAIMEEREIE
jgi:regulator of replication initiation timing